MIQSNFRGMGSGLVADGLGFMFQDRGQLFSLRDGHPNIYAPGKRPFQTIIPGFAVARWRALDGFGVMGGDMQPQGQTQIIVNRVDYGLEIQAAGRQPALASRRFLAIDGRGCRRTLMPAGCCGSSQGYPRRRGAALAAIGWKLGSRTVGSVATNASRDAGRRGRVYAAASEMRADGIALAF